MKSLDELCEGQGGKELSRDVTHSSLGKETGEKAVYFFGNCVAENFVTLDGHAETKVMYQGNANEQLFGKLREVYGKETPPAIPGPVM